MSDEYRKIANRLVKESIVNGELDFDKLRENTRIAVEAQMKKNSSYREFRDNGQLADLRDFTSEKFTEATREVLGLVPASEWRDKPFLGSDFKPDHGLVITQQPKSYDPEKSLASQGYVFLTKAEKANRQGQLQQVTEQLAERVDHVTSKESQGGKSLTLQEQKNIEISMQKLLKEHDANDVTFGVEGGKILRDTLKKLKDAGVTTDNEVLGDELRAIGKLQIEVPKDKGKGR